MVKQIFANNTSLLLWAYLEWLFFSPENLALSCILYSSVLSKIFHIPLLHVVSDGSFPRLNGCSYPKIIAPLVCLWLWNKRTLCSTGDIINLPQKIKNIYPSNDTKISELLNISGVCQEISSMRPEIWIVHKDCAIFILSHKSFQIAQLFPACVRKFTMCIWNFSYWYKFLECVCKICSMCPETLIIQNYHIWFFIIWHNKFSDCLKNPACVWKF